MQTIVSQKCIPGFKPKHQVDGIPLLGKLDSASVWYQVFVDSIVLKYLRFKVIIYFELIKFIVILIPRNFILGCKDL